MKHFIKHLSENVFKWVLLRGKKRVLENMRISVWYLKWKLLLCTNSAKLFSNILILRVIYYRNLPISVAWQTIFSIPSRFGNGKKIWKNLVPAKTSHDKIRSVTSLKWSVSDNMIINAIGEIGPHPRGAEVLATLMSQIQDREGQA